MMMMMMMMIGSKAHLDQTCWGHSVCRFD